MEGRVYLVNLTKYTEGIPAGEWFSLPIDEEEVRRRMRAYGECNEIVVHDFNLPFRINEYISLKELNWEWELANDLPEELQKELSVLLEWFHSVEELSNQQENLVFYEGIQDMEELAIRYVEEMGYLEQIPEKLRHCIDYVALGEQMETEGNFLFGKTGIFEVLRS